MSEKPFETKMRRLYGGVDMSFYRGGDDMNAEVSLAGLGDFESGQWRHNVKNQILSVGLKPERKQFVFGRANVLGGGYYLYDGNRTTVFPLWSKTWTDGEKKFSAPPRYTVKFYLQRAVEHVFIVGDEQLNEGPLEYNLILKVPKDRAEPFPAVRETMNDSTFLTTALTRAQCTVTAQPNGDKLYSFPVNVAARAAETFAGGVKKVVRQLVALDCEYPATEMTLEIKTWNMPWATAKIMHFSNSMQIAFDNGELTEISVLEEKLENIETLAYGLTSNSCTVRVVNRGGRFTRNRELLKKNRILQPKISADNANYYPLGKFFSDSWEVPAQSETVVCKGYDVLYNLQKIYIDFYTQKDGAFTLPQNMTAGDAFRRVIDRVNQSKAESGIFGSDVHAQIDERLFSIAAAPYLRMNYVLLGYDTAWNMLTNLANYAQSFVYVNREGVVCVERDDFGPNDTRPKSAVKTQITPSNAFTYNRPTLSRTIVNRVIVPYFRVVEGNDDDNKFTFEEKDFSYDEQGRIVLQFELKNFCSSITEIVRCQDNDFKFNMNKNFSSVEIKYNQVKIIFNAGETAETIYIKIVGNTSVLEEQTLIVNDFESQKKNGIVEYTLETGGLIVNESVAQAMAQKIISAYGNGRGYIEAQWIGTPELELGDRFQSCSEESSQLTDYECVSNEFTLSNGLRVTTKAREY